MAERETQMMGSARMTMFLPSMHVAPKQSLLCRMHADSVLSPVGTMLSVRIGLSAIHQTIPDHML